MARVENDVSPSIVQAGLVPPDLPCLAEHPVLVASLVVTGPQPHRLVQVLLLGRAVHALVGPLVTKVPAGHGLAWACPLAGGARCLGGGWRARSCGRSVCGVSARGHFIKGP